MLLMRRGFARTCRWCGAGAHNGYKHDENCLINTPVDDMHFWRMGFENRLKSPVIIMKSNVPYSVYVKGVRCAEKKLEA